MSRRSVAQTSSNNPTLALTKALQGVNKSEESFTKSVDKLKELLTDTFSDLETKLEAKQKELDDLKLRYEQEEKNRKIEVDQNIREYSYDAAKRILSARDEVAVRSEDYENLKEDYAELRAKKDQEVKDAVSAERKRNDQHNEAMKRTLELQKQAEVAKVEAQLETQIQHIDVLKSTIENLKSDLNEQRKLTKDVAQAASHRQPAIYAQQPGSFK
jgi:hypothetical protein